MSIPSPMLELGGASDPGLALLHLFSRLSGTGLGLCFWLFTFFVHHGFFSSYAFCY
jgi:hypothetical protein